MNSITKLSQPWMPPTIHMLFTAARFSLRQYCQGKTNGTTGVHGIDNVTDNVTGTSAAAIDDKMWERCGNNKDDESSKLTKISASAQLVKGLHSETELEAPEPILWKVELENVRSKFSELDQRKVRHEEYVKMIERLRLKKPATLHTAPKLPFKQPAPANDMRLSLRSCSCAEEVLKLTKDSEQLAKELVRLACELSTEKRKAAIAIESYLELKQEMIDSKAKSS